MQRSQGEALWRVADTVLLPQGRAHLSQPPSGQGSRLYVPHIRRLWLLESCLDRPRSLYPEVMS